MTVSLHADSSVARVVFRDALGDRVPIPDRGGPGFELLRVRAELAATAGFEPALEARATALAGFRDPSFAAVHRVDRMPQGSALLAVFAERPAGIRLSVLLDRARSGALDTTPRIAIAALRQLAPALVRLHERAPGISHGALAAERVVVAPSGRLRMTDVAFGSAIEGLNLSRRELWRTFRIAAPPAAGSVRLNDRADLMQLGMLALALLAGRPIEPDEFPGSVAGLARETVDRWAARQRPLPHAIATWLLCALQLDPRRSYPTMGAALVALADTPAWQIDEASAQRVLTAWSTGETVSRIARRDQVIRLAADNPSPIAAARSSGAVHPRPKLVAGPSRAPARRVAPAVVLSPRPQPRQADPAPPPPARRRPWWRLFAAMLAVASVGAIAVAGTQRYGSGTSPQDALTSQSSPSDLDVLVDRVPTTGWLVVEAPFDVEVRADGRSLSATGNRRIALGPGRHAIEIVNDTLGFRETRNLAILAGEPTPLVVQAPFGTVHLNAKPWAEVWLDGQRIGETPIGNLAVPIGAREFVFSNPEFGERRHAVSVTLTAPVHLTVDMQP